MQRTRRPKSRKTVLLSVAAIPLAVLIALARPESVLPTGAHAHETPDKGIGTGKQIDFWLNPKPSKLANLRWQLIYHQKRERIEDLTKGSGIWIPDRLPYFPEVEDGIIAGLCIDYLKESVSIAVFNDCRHIGSVQICGTQTVKGSWNEINRQFIKAPWGSFAPKYGEYYTNNDIMNLYSHCPTGSSRWLPCPAGYRCSTAGTDRGTIVAVAAPTTSGAAGKEDIAVFARPTP